MLHELPVVVGLALLISVTVKSLLVQAFYIPSESMEETLLVDDRVLVNKLVDAPDEIHRGDIVVFRDPGAWLDPVDAPAGPRVWMALRTVLAVVGLAPSADDEDLVKRVIGIGGDRVRCCDEEGRVSVNGVGLDETYLFPGSAASETAFDVRVPRGSLWMMGDHREVSRDSREHQDDRRGGVVPVASVVGRTFAVVWPLHRARGFDTPAPFRSPALDRHVR